VQVRKQDRIELLKSVWLFKDCSRRQLDQLATLAVTLQVDSGSKLTSEGGRRREFLVIVDGQAEVSRNGQRLALLGPGDFIGETSLLDRDEQVATVTTTKPTTVLVMTAANFEVLLRDLPSLARDMLTVVSRRLRDLETRYVTPKKATTKRALAEGR
jgi:CRP-like cAMP-binding protein